MSEALYERYKDALRRGHAAAARGHNKVALHAYSEAAELAPDRALPLVGMGQALIRIRKYAEALTVFDAALDRAPADEAAIRGRATALAATGDRAGAADAYDRVAPILDAAGRLAEAADCARLALELAESRGRRATVRAYAARLRDIATVNEAAARALEKAEAVLAEVPTADASLAPEVPPFHPGTAVALVEEAIGSGDPAAVRAAALEAAAGHRAQGLADTAIDACYLALVGSPDDTAVHLELAEIYLDREWRDLAIDKLALVARFADLTGDGVARERARAIAAARLSDEPRLAVLTRV